MLGGSKGKKSTKWQKTPPVTAYISGTIYHMILICCKHVRKDNIFRFFKNFFQILIFGVNSRVKDQKMAQKIMSVAPISQEACIIWVWFLVHMCKMMTAPEAFFIFSKLVRAVKVWKRTKKSLTPYFRNPTSYDRGFLVHMSKKTIFAAVFFIFSKFWFFEFLAGEGGEAKGQKMTHNYQFQSVTL